MQMTRGQGGCFGENSSVMILKKGSKEYAEILVRDLEKDDDVLVSGGQTAKLVCLVKINKTE